MDRGSIPPGGANYAAVPADARVPVEPLFAEDTVEYVGQPIGLVLATSQVRLRGHKECTQTRRCIKCMKLLPHADGDRRQHRVQRRWCRSATRTTGTGGPLCCWRTPFNRAPCTANKVGERQPSHCTQHVRSHTVYDRSVIDRGDVERATSSAPHAIRGAQWRVPSQYHFYMEPQTAVAIPDEGGRLEVHASAQGIDMVQQAVATALGMPMTDVLVKCR